MALQEVLQQKHFKGFIETVPAYASLAIFYDMVKVTANYPIHTTVYDFVRDFTEQSLNALVGFSSQHTKPPISLPVHYNGEDLIGLANLHHLSAEEVIKIHTGKIVRVFMIGFLPGFAYMGKVDDRIATARLVSPRAVVKPGSVGIAGSQTGIYPLASPGGWQLIGQTPIKIFDSKKETPCFFQAGDLVQFVAISKKEFDQLNEY